MRCSLTHPLGVEVTGCPPLPGLDAAAVGAIAGLLARHGVVVLPGQDIDDAGFVAFLARFGRLTFTKGEIPVAGFPDLNVVSNVGRTLAPRSTFHVDTSYVREPPAYTALRAVAIPAAGGETLFTDQYAAYDTLDPDLRTTLAGRTITHVATGVDLDPGDESSAQHRVFRRHPVSGRTSLYLSTPRRCVSVSGMSPAESTEVVRALYDHSTREGNTLRHRWSAGDVVMWDNRCVLHRADHAGVVGDRVLHRGLVAAA
jgi:taurine dioxygenase